MKGKWRSNPYICGGLTLFVVVAASMIFYRIISDFSGVGAILKTFVSVFLPFIIGPVLAYLLSPVYDFVQRPCERWFAGKKATPRKWARPASKALGSAAAIVVLLAVVGGLLSLVIPQAYKSISNLIVSMPEKSAAVLAWIEEISQKIGIGDMITTWLSQAISWLTETLTAWAEQDLLPNIADIAKDFSTGLIDAVGIIVSIVVGVIVCVYILNSKELFAAQAKKVLFAVFKPRNANYILQVTRYIDQTFGHYINGVLLDALVLGLLCFIVTSILQIPYALLISTLVGLCNIVPIFGPFVAIVFGAFFVLLESPFKALLFIIVAMILNQIDANIIAPKILGDKTGISGIWVIFAIVVGGGFFGFLGMVLGVPAFAVIYALISRFLEHRLRKKHIPEETAAFDGLWEIDEDTGEPRYGSPNTDVEVPDPPESENGTAES